MELHTGDSDMYQRGGIAQPIEKEYASKAAVRFHSRCRLRETGPTLLLVE